MPLTLSDNDWSKLTPERFEWLCRDLLRSMEFEQVEHFGGSGDKGRDLRCVKQVSYGPGISRAQTVIVQCKHTPRGLARPTILEDLAKTVEHQCDLWWLMTSAKLTPGDLDWLGSLASRKYGFGIHWVPRATIEHWLSIFPAVLNEYFPSVMDKSRHAHAHAMKLMESGQYAQATAALQLADDGHHARTSYLRACCSSQMAATDTARRAEHLNDAEAHLRAAHARGFIEFLEREFGWPVSKALYQVNTDPELQAIRTARPSLFDGLFPLPRSGGGGCFPRGTLMRMSDAGQSQIEAVTVGDAVASLIDQGHFGPSSVRGVGHTLTTALNRIRTSHPTPLTATDSQKVLSTLGWVPANAVAPGDLLVSQSGICIVFEVSREQVQAPVWHLELADTPVYYANGYCVHNKLIAE